MKTKLQTYPKHPSARSARASPKYKPPGIDWLGDGILLLTGAK
ncbi:MAG: hypothetical protein Q8R13_01750 [bacterium]|nr:hypothetical protein [bacterium]